MHASDWVRGVEVGVSFLLVTSLYLLYNFGQKELLVAFLTLSLYTFNRITAYQEGVERRKHDEEVKDLLTSIANASVRLNQEEAHRG